MIVGVVSVGVVFLYLHSCLIFSDSHYLLDDVVHVRLKPYNSYCVRVYQKTKRFSDFFALYTVAVYTYLIGISEKKMNFTCKMDKCRSFLEISAP